MQPPSTSETTPSSYDNLSDPALHRKGQEVLLSSEADSSPIVNFCPYAGKQGRPRPENDHNQNVKHAVLSGTVLWLVCPLVNNLIARLERSGGVKKIDARLKEDPFLGPLHEASHNIYASYVTTVLLKDPEEQKRFLNMFVFVGGNAMHGTELNGTDSSAKVGNWNRKYGNAGVSAPRDLKCFHAVAAQALGGAANPVGCIVVMYLFKLYDVLQTMETDERISEVEKVETRPAEDQLYVTSASALSPSERKPDPGAPSRRTFAAKKADFAAYVDDFGNFEQFLDECIAENRLSFDESTTSKLPKLSIMAKEMLVAIEGHQPFLRKKRRVH